MNRLLFVTSSWRTQLERPQEFVDVLEVSSDGKDFVNHIFNANNSVLLELLGNDFVVSDWSSLTAKFSKTALVNEFSHSLQVGCSPSNVGLNKSQHFDSGSIESHKDGILNLTKTEKSQNLSCTGINTIDTPNSNNQSEFWFRFSEEVATRASSSS